MNAIRSVIVAKPRAKPPEGYEEVDGSKNGAYRKKKSGGGYEYWYPSSKHAGKDIKHHMEKKFYHKHMHEKLTDVAKKVKDPKSKKHFAGKAQEHKELSETHHDIVDGAHDFYYGSAGKKNPWK